MFKVIANCKKKKKLCVCSNLFYFPLSHNAKNTYIFPIPLYSTLIHNSHTLMKKKKTGK